MTSDYFYSKKSHHDMAEILLDSVKQQPIGTSFSIIQIATLTGFLGNNRKTRKHTNNKESYVFNKSLVRI